MLFGYGYFEKFSGVMDRYLSDMGEGKTLATQIVTAVVNLVYGWLNNGDVYDNRNKCGLRTGNNISCYANWLARHATPLAISGEIITAGAILDRIKTVSSEDEYENILRDLADTFLDEGYLEAQSKKPAVATIYTYPGEYAPVLMENKEGYKPCPHCGGFASWIWEILGENDAEYYRVRCKTCGAQTAPYFYFEDAKKAWNRRDGDG